MLPKSLRHRFMSFIFKEIQKCLTGTTDSGQGTEVGGQTISLPLLPLCPLCLCGEFLLSAIATCKWKIENQKPPVCLKTPSAIFF